jgi:hypothetical protein
MVDNQKMRMLTWIVGTLTLVGTFAGIAAVTVNAGVSLMWGVLAVGTFIFGYIFLLAGIMHGFFGGDI